MPSKIIRDLKSVPNIVGELGLNIAAAQKALNYDYLQNLEHMVGVARDLIGKPGANPAPPPPGPDALAILKDVITQLAPTRYVYTETSLAVRLDLAQGFEGGAQVGLGGGIGAVMVNAAFSLAFSQDYRGTAECRTVIHPDGRSGAVNEALMGRVQQLAQQRLEIPDQESVNAQIYDSLKAIQGKLS